MPCLPDCLLLHILGACDAATLVRLAVCSKELAALARSQSEELWRNLVTTRFEPVRWVIPARSLTPTDGQSWRDLYVQLSQPGTAGHWRVLAAASHSLDESCWLVIGAHIYDVTEFMHRHPGLPDALRLFGGEDAEASAACTPLT